METKTKITLDQLRLTVDRKYKNKYKWITAMERSSQGLPLALWLLIESKFADAQVTWSKTRSDEDIRNSLVVRRGASIITQAAASSVAMILLEWEVEHNAVDVADVLNGMYPVFGSPLLESDLVWSVSKARPRVQSGMHYVEEAGFGLNTGVVLSYAYGFTPYTPPEEWGTSELAVFYVTEYQDGTLWIRADDPLEAFTLDVYVTKTGVYKGKGALKYKDVISSFCAWYWDRGRDEYFNK